VTICLGPDSAGDAGIASCIRDLRAAGIAVYVAPRLLNGQDPDDFILAHGIDAWKAHVKKAIHAFRWQARQILAGHHLPPENDAEADAIVREAVAYAAKQPPGADEELLRHYWPAIAVVAGSSAEALQARSAAARKMEGNGKNLGVEPTAPADWPEPLPIPNDLPPVPVFDAEALLPRASVNFVSDVAMRMQCPIDFPAIALMIVTGFSGDELLRLLDSEANAGQADPDDVPAPPDAAVTQTGDLWLLGKHRLLCGDSSTVEDVDQLLDGAAIHLANTDPPYNVKSRPPSLIVVDDPHNLEHVTSPVRRPRSWDWLRWTKQEPKGATPALSPQLPLTHLAESSLRYVRVPDCYLSKTILGSRGA
jgi:hypothetical protein